MKVTFLSLFLLFASLTVQAVSPQKITGRVTDTEGEVLAGVTIVEKGTSNGTATDINGSYSIAITTDEPLLVASYVGYESLELKGGKPIVDFILKQEISLLNEVQVVGYGTQRKVSVVGAQSSIKMEHIKAPVANMSSILAGRISGLVAVQRTGLPGHDDSDIWIRGISTLTNVNQGPLVLVDGIERSFSQLDPEDIESVTVLKDASSTAVYGVRGGNGVIIITTKPGVVSSRPKFTVDYYEGVTMLTQIPKLVDAYQYMDAVNEAYVNSTGKPYYSEQYIQNTQMADGLIPHTGDRTINKYLYPNVNWMNELYNKWGNNRRANINIRGGAPYATYYISLSYYDEKGMTKTDPKQNYNTEIAYNRYNFVSNINLRVTSKTRVDVGVNGWFSGANYPAQDIENEIFKRAMQINPVLYPVEYPDGKNPGYSQFQREFDNPYGELTKRGYKNEYKTQINSNLKLAQDLDYWSWSKGLTIHGLMAFDVKDEQTLTYKRDGSTWKPSGTRTGDVWNNDAYDADGNLLLQEEYKGTPTLTAESNRNSYRTFYLEAGINYNRRFGIHSVTGLGLFNMRDYRDPNKASLLETLPYKQLGVSSRLTYSYDDRYFVELNAGYTGSENFSEGHRFGFFPAAAIGWVLSNEKFWEPIEPYISYLKLRYSNGVVGSDNMGGTRFGYNTEITDKGGYPIYGTGGRVNSGIGINKYGYQARWSTVHKQDLGVEVNFLKNSLSLVFDLFKERRDKIFVTRHNVPIYAGFAVQASANTGIVENQGFEASFDYNKQIGKDWNISVRGNFTMNQDKIIENDEPIPAYPWLGKKGKNVLVRMGYVAEGLYSSNEEIKQRNITQFGETYPGQLVQPGDIKYRDLNGDNHIDANDMQAIGRGDVPKYYFGFGGDFRYRNIGLGILFQGTAGADRLLEGSGIRPFINSSGGGTLYANINNRWSPDNPSNDNVFYPRLAWSSADPSNVNNYVPSTWWQKDMGFLRLKQFTLSYYFPQSWFKGTFIHNGRFYLMGSNVVTWSRFKLWDPELDTTNGIKYPNVSAYSLGVNFSF